MDLGFDVVGLGPADHPAEGDRAPDFVRPLVNEEFWEDAALSELADGGRVLLVFHTMDGAFPAIYVADEIQDRGWAARDDLTVVGLSISTPYEHASFVAERDLDYRLFSDPGNEVAETYGIAHDLDGMSGVNEPRPAVFLLDEDRVIEYAWVATEWPEFPPYDELEAALRE